ncbi:MAG: tetratricopeptide repeat protein [Crocinitomicaceae bacterium]|nr:tetratricopeptide repeat protein [Flavobacteriales bacterium]NQZ35617.1 tetratricopeptide repeat protein [Crocinitomicaceae bacterium]
MIDKNYREASILLEELVSRENELDAKKIPIVHNNLGIAKYGLGDFSAGIKHYKIALDSYQDAKNDTLSAQANLNLGLAYKEIGADSMASTMIYRAIYTFRKLDLKQEEVSALSSLGNLYRDGQQFTRSEYFLNESLKLSKKINYDKGIAYAFHGLGTLMLEKGSYTEAEDYFQRSLSIKDSLKLKKHAATTCAKLGELYLILNDCKKAKFYLDKSIALRSENGSANDLKSAMNYFHLGQLQQKCGTNNSSEEYYLKASNIFLKQPGSTDLLKTYEALLGIYKLQGRTKDALEVSTKLIELKQVILGENNQKEIAKLGIEYDVMGHENAVKLKEQENEHLTFRNTVISAVSVALLLFLVVVFILFRNNVLKKKKIESQNEMLNAKNRDIITLHDELSHRTNNFFSLLQGMLRIDSENNEFSKNELLSLYESRIQAMSDVQRHLVLGVNDSMITVDFKAYLLELIENSEILYAQKNLTSINHNIDTLQIQTTRYEIPTRVGIVLNELINNSIKHNRDQKVGVIVSIYFEYKDQQLKIQFSDNGVLSKPDSSSNGAGLVLIRELLQPIEGSITYKLIQSFEATLVIPINTKNG